MSRLGMIKSLDDAKDGCGRVAMVIVEHHAESVLPLVDRAYVLVNGRAAFGGRRRCCKPATRCKRGC